MSISETTVIVIEEEPPARKRPKIVSSCKERGADESVTLVNYDVTIDVMNTFRD